MSSNSHVSELLARTEEYTKTHVVPPFIKDVAVPERAHTVIYCCADGRVNPIALFGLKLVDAIVIRSAGCAVSRNIGDLLVLDQFLELREVLVLSHTDCGLTHTMDDTIRKSLKGRITGHDENIDNLYIGAFQDHAERVKSDVDFIKTHPLVRRELAENVFGAVFDIKTGTVTRVEI